MKAVPWDSQRHGSQTDNHKGETNVFNKVSLHETPVETQEQRNWNRLS